MKDYTECKGYSSEPFDYYVCLCWNTGEITYLSVKAHCVEEAKDKAFAQVPADLHERIIVNVS